MRRRKHYFHELDVGLDQWSPHPPHPPIQASMPPCRFVIISISLPLSLSLLLFLFLLQMAAALGVERTRNELVPYLSEFLDGKQKLERRMYWGLCAYRVCAHR